MIELGADISKECFDDSGKNLLPRSIVGLGLFRDHILEIDDDDPDDVLYRIVYGDGYDKK